MISALAVCGFAVGVGALKSRSKMLLLGAAVGAGGAAAAVVWGAGGRAVGVGGAVVIGGARSSEPNKSTTGAAGAGEGLAACVRERRGCVRAAPGAGAGAEYVGVGFVEVSTGG
jgi:hypothetical protein